jgi:thioredoxin-like negative regulator of GroEL
MVAVVLLALVFGPQFAPRTGLPDQVRIALIEASAHGLVHPLVADEPSIAVEVTRGAAGEIDESILDGLSRAADADPGDASALCNYIIGLQAAGRDARIARDVLDDALFDHPQDDCLHDLAIYQLYLEGEVQLLEVRLRHRIEEDPEDELAAINLAIVLMGMNDPEASAEAVQLAQDLADQPGDSIINVRARRLLTRSSG